MNMIKTKFATAIAATALLALGAFGLHSVWIEAKAENAASVEPTVTHADCFGGESTHDGAIALTADVTTLTDGNKYYLDGDLSLSGTLTVANNATVSICLNGHVLRAAADTRAIEMLSGAKLSLYDCNSDGCTHYYSKGGNGVYSLDAALTAQTADGAVSGGVITGGNIERAGAIYVRGTFIMYGGTIAGNTATGTNGGGLFADNHSNSYLRGGAFCGNYAKNRGGGFYITAGAYCEMNDGVSVTENTVDFGGGGIFINNTVFDMNGGTVAYNHAPNGGGIYSDGGTCSIKGGLIEHNTASAQGGGVYVSGGIVEMYENGTIDNNTAVNNGGGVVAAYGTFDLYGGAITNNKANTGGGVQINGEGKLEIHSGAVNGNESLTGHGGAIFVNNGGTAVLGGGTVNGNTAKRGGGGIFITAGGSATVSNDAEIANNTASEHGGGVYVHQSAELTMSGGTIKDNTTAMNGGGVFINTESVGEQGAFGQLTMTGGTISGNTALRGGGVYINADFIASGVFTLNGGAVKNNSAVAKIASDGNGEPYVENAYGGGIYVNGTLELSGSSEISGNKCYADTSNPTKANDSNVYLNTDKTITIAGELANTERIGVAAANASASGFTNGYAASGNTEDPNTYFVADDKTYLITQSGEGENGEAVFAVCEHVGTTSHLGTDNPTCEVDGAEHYSCTYCGKTWDIKIEKTGHSYGDYEVTTQPTYDAAGEETSVCSECGDSITRSIPALSKPAEKTTSWLWLYILIGFIVLVVLFVIIILLVNKKKRKDKDKEEEKEN